MAFRTTVGSTTYAFADLKDSWKGDAAALRRSAGRGGGRHCRRECRGQDCAVRCIAEANPRRSGRSLRVRLRYAPHRRHARRTCVSADFASHGRRVPRFPAVGDSDARCAYKACTRDHTGDGGGGLQAHAESGPHPGGQEMPGRHALPQHHRLTGHFRRAAATQSPDRRPRWHFGSDPGWPDVWRGGCGDRNKSCDRCTPAHR